MNRCSALLMAFSVAACTQEPSPSNAPAPDVQATPAPPAAPAAVADPPADAAARLRRLEAERARNMAEVAAQPISPFAREEQRSLEKRWWTAEPADCVPSRAPDERVRMLLGEGWQPRVKDLPNGGVEISAPGSDGRQTLWTFYRRRSDCVASLPVK